MDFCTASSSASIAEVKAGGTIRLNVPKLAEFQLGTEVRSQGYLIANILWFLEVQQVVRENVKNLGVYAYCNHSNKDSRWSCDAEVRFRLQPQKAGKLPHDMMLTKTFDHQSHNWGFSFMKWDDVMNPEKGYLREDGGIVVMATITVTNVVVRQTACDFSTPQPSISEVAPVIGEQCLRVSKDYLAIFSPVFKAMFIDDFDENEMKEIPLKDVDYDEFVELLHVIYPSRKPVTVDNVEFLLRLGDRYNIQSVVRECEQLLCGDCKVPLEKKLLWADKYRLARLQFASLNAIKTMDEAKMLNSTAEFGDFSLQMKEALLERILLLD